MTKTVLICWAWALMPQATENAHMARRREDRDRCIGFFSRGGCAVLRDIRSTATPCIDSLSIGTMIAA
jgi:hypothetical protein